MEDPHRDGAGAPGDPSGGAPSDRRRRARRATRLGLALVGTIAGAELALRLTGFEAPRPAGYSIGLYVPDPESGYRLGSDFHGLQELPGRAVEVHTDELGLRVPADGGPDAAREDAADARATRVLSIGDSFAFGHGVRAEQAYPALLEALAVEAGLELRVFNAGVPGHNPLNYLGSFERLVDRLAPDRVLLGIYLGNDVSGCATPGQGPLTVRQGFLVADDPELPGWWLDLKAWAFAHSRLVFALAGAFGGRADGPDPTGPLDPATARELAEWEQGFAVGTVRTRPSPEFERAWDLALGACRELAARCGERGIELVPVLLPAPQQYDPALWSLYLGALAEPPEAFDLEAPSDRFRAAFAELGIEVLDLLPDFRTARAAGAQLYTDVHFDVDGHRLAAERILARLAAGESMAVDGGAPR